MGGDPHDPTWFRTVLGQYPTGVSVVTGVDRDGTPAGLVVGSFTSVSLTPPLVAFFPDKSSTSWPKIEPSGRFCVNVLAHDQEHHCRRFAARGGDKFGEVRWRAGATGAPIIEDVVAWIDCELEAVQDAGDHLIVLGRVRELEVERAVEPLLFFRGGYGRFAPLSLAIGGTGLADELRLVDLARAEMEKVAAELQAQCVAWALVGDELVLLASAGSPERRAERPAVPASAIGARIPAIPPVGSIWMAYADSARVEAWLARAPERDRDQHRARLEEVRRRGYSVALRGSELAQLEALLEQGRVPATSDVVRSLPLDPIGFTAELCDRVAVLDVPAFDGDGQVALLLGLHGFRRLPDADALAHVVTRLREAAGEVAQRGVLTGACTPHPTR